MEIDVYDRDDQALNGFARRRQLKVVLSNSQGRCEFTVLLYLPAQSAAPSPLFLGLNFMGNHTVDSDPSIALPTSWSPQADDGGTWAEEKKRGSWVSRWPIKKILQRGYGVATIYNADFAPDHPEHFKEGLLQLDRSSSDEAQGRTIAAWACGLSRTLDVLGTLPEIDPKRIAATGHSRMGKAALWAGACDSRFSLVISNDSGSGGAALFRRRIGERIIHLTGNFPHWFTESFRRYEEKENELPIDQHQLLALIAPRAVYVASAADDLWADPVGEYQALAAAAPAWGEEFPLTFPGNDTPLRRGQLGYHVRSGPHDIREYDWQQFMNFADRVWKSPVA